MPDSSGPDAAPRTNPYVGPRAFEATDRAWFFGRDDERSQLTSLIVAHRVVLFYARSGAGKSSLLKASVIPDLVQRKRIEVLPLARVSGHWPEQVDPASLSNIFVYNTLASLGASSAASGALAANLGAGLASFVSAAGTEGRVNPRLLVIDQFEEIFTTHADRHAERADFFHQLQQCLDQHPHLSLLLSMREDYIAWLDYFAAALHDRLRTRFRMERLGVTGAHEAISAPAAKAGRPIAEGVAERIVDDLRRIQVGTSLPQTGDVTTALGDYVEPVQLQIVCWELWNRLPPGGNTIRSEDYEAYGNVDQALTRFYEDALHKAGQVNGVNQRRLRTWVGEKLITPSGTRGIVRRDTTETAGLPNQAVDELTDAYLIRAEERGGDRYYELTHDRLVEPVLRANRAWWDAYDNPLVAPTQSWLQGGKDTARLLDGKQLAQAQAYAAGHVDELLEDEQEFLVQSVAARRRRRLWLATGIGASLLVLLLTGLLAWVFAQQAAREAALRQQAENQTQLSRSRELAAAAVSNLTVDPELSLLLAQQAHAITYTGEAENALRQALQTSRIERTLLFTENVPQTITMSPDGRDLIVGGRAGLLEVYALGTPSLVPTLVISAAGPTSTVASPAINDVVITPDGQSIVAAVADGTVRAWDAASGVPQFVQLVTEAPVKVSSGGGEEPTVEGQAGVLALAINSQGDRLAAVASDGMVKVLDLTSKGDMLLDFLAHDGGTTSVAFGPDGRRLATAGRDATAMLWDATTGELLETLQGHTDRVFSVAFSPDGQRLATAGADKTVILWDVSGAEAVPVRTLYDATNSVAEIAFSPNGYCVAAASLDRIARLWDAQTGKLLINLPGHTDWVTAAAFRPDGSAPGSLPLPAQPCGVELATASRDGTVRLWNIGPTAEQLTIIGPTAPVESVAYSPDGSQIVSADDSGAVTMWNAGDGRRLRDFVGHTDRVNQVTFAPDGKTLATASWDTTIGIWDAGNGFLIRRIEGVDGHFDRVQSVAFNPDGMLLASGSDDQTAILFDASTYEQQASVRHGTPVFAVAFAPSQPQLATAGGSGEVAAIPDGRIDLWHVDDQEQQQEMLAGATVYAVAYSPDGKTLASVSWDGVARLWSPESGELLRALAGHTDRLYGVGFAPDGKLLATSGGDRTVRVWDPSTGDVRHTFYGPEFNGLMFSPDGQHLAVGGEDGTVRIYTLSIPELLELSNARVTRSLTADECRTYLQMEECPSS